MRDEADRRWRETHREERREYDRQWRADNKDLRRRYMATWRAGQGKARVSEPSKRAPQLLSERQREVLTLLAQGKSNDAIADELAITPVYARNIITVLYSKIRAQGGIDESGVYRVQAALWWLEQTRMDWSYRLQQKLNPREIQVLSALAAGMDDAAIQERYERANVAALIQSIYTKLGIAEDEYRREKAADFWERRAFDPEPLCEQCMLRAGVFWAGDLYLCQPCRDGGQGGIRLR